MFLSFGNRFAIAPISYSNLAQIRGDGRVPRVSIGVRLPDECRAATQAIRVRMIGDVLWGEEVQIREGGIVDLHMCDQVDYLMLSHADGRSTEWIRVEGAHEAHSSPAVTRGRVIRPTPPPHAGRVVAFRSFVTRLADQDVGSMEIGGSWIDFEPSEDERSSRAVASIPPQGAIRLEWETDTGELLTEEVQDGR